MPPYPGFVGPSYTSLSIIAAQERTVNFYIEQVETPYGKSKRVLYPTPGYLLRADGGASNLVGGIRALYTSRVNQQGAPGTKDWYEACYAVVGSQLCQLGYVTEAGSPVNYALGMRYSFTDLGSVEGLGLPIWTYRSETGPELDLYNGAWVGGVYPPTPYPYDVGTGIVFNHSTDQRLATMLTLNFKAADGTDARALYDAMRVNDGLLLQSVDNPGLWHRFRIAGPPYPPPAELTGPTYTDNFNRADGPLGANWAHSPGMNILNNQVAYQGPPDTTGIARWIGSANGAIPGRNQFSEVIAIYGQFCAVAVRITADGKNYVAWWGNGQVKHCVTSAGFNEMIYTYHSGIHYGPGSRVRMEMEGDNLRLYLDGVYRWGINLYAVDGAPGIVSTNLVGPLLVDDWTGGFLKPTTFRVPVVYTGGPDAQLAANSRMYVYVEQIGLLSWQTNWPTGGLFFSFIDADLINRQPFYEAGTIGDTIVLVDAANPANTETHKVTGPGATPTPSGERAAGLHGQGFYLATEKQSSTGESLMGKRVNAQLRAIIPFPADGLIAWNHANQQAATAISFDWRSDDNLDTTLMKQTAALDNVLLLQGEADPTNKIKYRVTGPAISDESRYTIPVVFVSAEGAGVFADNVRLRVALNEETIGPPIGFEGDKWPAVITDNGDGGRQLVVSSGGYLWVWGDPFTPETSGGGPVKVDGLSNIACCASVDGFVIALDVINGILHSSVLFDALNFPGLAIDQRTSAPDPWRWMIVQNSLLYVMGERTTDVYYNAGLANFPLAKHTGGTIPFGIGAVQSAAVVGNGWMMVSRTGGGIGQVVFVFGQTAEVVSDHALDAAIEEYNRTTTIVDALGESFEILGHVFYLLTFPAANASWLFDLQTKTWTEIASSEAGHFRSWRPHWHAVYEGRRLMGDRHDVLLYELDHTVATEAGPLVQVEGVWQTTTTPVHRQRRAPSLFSENKRIFFNSLELFMETGIGNPGPEAIVAGYDPMVTLSYSNDGGHTFTNAAAKSSAGRAGQYRVRVSWNRLGSARDRVFQLDMSDPVPWRLIDASLDIRPGAGT